MLHHPFDSPENRHCTGCGCEFNHRDEVETFDCSLKDGVIAYFAVRCLACSLTVYSTMKHSKTGIPFPRMNRIAQPEDLALVSEVLSTLNNPQKAKQWQKKFNAMKKKLKAMKNK